MTDQIAGMGYSLQVTVNELKPTLDGIYTLAVKQNAATNSALTFLFVGFDVFASIACIILLSFVNVEKDIATKQKEIKARNNEKTNI